MLYSFFFLGANSATPSKLSLFSTECLACSLGRTLKSYTPKISTTSSFYSQPRGIVFCTQKCFRGHYEHFETGFNWFLDRKVIRTANNNSSTHFYLPQSPHRNTRPGEITNNIQFNTFLLAPKPTQKCQATRG